VQHHRLSFTHERIDPDPPSERLTFCEPVDLTGNGRLDVVVGGKGAPSNLHVLGRGTRFPNYRRRLRDLVAGREVNLFWYENTGDGWVRHRLADTEQLEVGAAVADIDGDGRPDLLVGRTINYDEVYWFRQPAEPRDTWPKRVLTDRFDMYHDLAVADVDDDGAPEVVGLSQAAETVFYYDIPEDPTVEPWPQDHCTVVSDDLEAEGLAVVDLDGDGRSELVAGTTVFHREDGAGDRWRAEQLLDGWDAVRVAVADLDGDGNPELVFAEGDSPAHGTHPARVAWVDPGEGDPHFLREEMFCPHSLGTADFTGNGRPDIYVGEMGLGENRDPEHVVFRNRGRGEFEEQEVARGVPTHEAKVADVNGNGRPDVVGKGFDPDPTVDVWYNQPG
jgi:hypothetical protein